MMKTVKMLLALVLALGMVMAFAACGEEEAKKTEPATTPAATEPSTQEASVETEPVNDNPTYTVTVVDEGGNPIADAMVQLCAEACYPNKTNELGVATFSLEEAEYKVSFLKMPEGYEAIDGATEYYFDAGSTEITITLKAVA